MKVTPGEVKKMVKVTAGFLDIVTETYGKFANDFDKLFLIDDEELEVLKKAAVILRKLIPSQETQKLAPEQVGDFFAYMLERGLEIHLINKFSNETGVMKGFSNGVIQADDKYWPQDQVVAYNILMPPDLKAEWEEIVESYEGDPVTKQLVRMFVQQVTVKHSV